MFDFKTSFAISDNEEYVRVTVDWETPAGEQRYSTHQTSGLGVDGILQVAELCVLDLLAFAYGENSKDNELGWKSVYFAHQRQIRRTLLEQIREFSFFEKPKTQARR